MNKIQNITYDIVEEALYKLMHTYQEIPRRAVPRERGLKRHVWSSG